MTNHPRVQPLIDELLDTGLTAEEVCAAHPELLPEVREQWNSVRRIRNELDALFPPVEEAVELLLPEEGHEEFPRIPGYEIEAVIGRGGMGIVYRARQLSLDRRVALKMGIAGALARPQERPRFQREAEAIARLQHPNIVQIHDIGQADGRAYFTMEFVEGGSLAQKLAATPQPAQDAAQLVMILASAMEAAHRCGIVHRDLKPANVLISVGDIPKISDFGLARRVDEAEGLTQSGIVLGTPGYMAPEQAQGGKSSVAPAVDVYALGAILYETLTGRPPFRAETALETIRQIITIDPVPPSRLNTNVPRDLENICLKCLHKEPSRRYSCAEELASDLQRFLNGQTVKARPVGFLERAQRWANRNRTIAASLFGMAFLLIVVLSGAVWSAAYFRHLEGIQRSLAEEKGALVTQKEKLLSEKETERVKAVAAEMRATELRRLAEVQEGELRQNLYLTEMNLAGQAATVPTGLGRVRELLAKWEAQAPDPRGWEWYFLNSIGQRALSTRIVHSLSVYSIAWSPDGQRIASASGDRSICICDGSSDSILKRIQGHTADVVALSWAPDGRRLVSASSDRTVRIWDTDTGAELYCYREHSSELTAVAWSPDGNLIASADSGFQIHVWNAGDGSLRANFQQHEERVTSLSWKNDSRQLASAARDATLRLWDIETGQNVRTLRNHANWVNQVAWSPDGSRLASVSNDETVRVWDAETGHEIQSLRGHAQGVTAVCWSPDGQRLITGSDDQTMKIWSVETGNQLLSYRGHISAITSISWNPHDGRVASASFDHSIRIHDVSRSGEPPVLSGHDSPVHAIAWCPRDASVLASTDSAGVTQIWDLSRRTIRQRLMVDSAAISSIAWHPGGDWLATGDANGRIRIWETGTGHNLKEIDLEHAAVRALDWTPDGRRLVSGHFDGTVCVLEVATGKVLRIIQRHDKLIDDVACSPDGQYVASASGDSTVRIHELASGNEICCYRGHGGDVVSVAWHPHRPLLASAGYDLSIQLWNPLDGRLEKLLRGHTTHIGQVLWSPDGERLASAGRDGATKIWDPATGKEALTLTTHSSQVNGVTWSPDGMTLASAGEDHQVHLLDATPGYYAARSDRLLSVIDQRLAKNALQTDQWKLRADVHVRSRKWREATADVRHYLLLQPRSSWFMADCEIASPYPEDLDVPCPPEGESLAGAEDFSQDSAKISTPVNWKTAPHSDHGVVDFGPFAEHRDHVSAYARFPVYSSDDQDVVVLLSTDDQARMWLNGTPVYEYRLPRAAIPDEDAIAIRLKAGWNSLLLRVANVTGDHSLCLRLSNAASDFARVTAPRK